MMTFSALSSSGLGPLQTQPGSTLSLPRNHAYMWSRYYSNAHSTYAPKVRLRIQVLMWECEVHGRQERHVSCVLCAPGGQVMCILLCLKVRCDFRGSRHPLSLTHTQLLCCLQEVQPALESAGCSSSLFYLSVLSPPLSVSHLLRVLVCLI